jgi:hypothetical protein
MAGEDAAFTRDVERRVAEGVTREMALASLRRHLVLLGAFALAFGMDIAAWRGGHGTLTPSAGLPTLLLLALVGAAVWRFIRWAPRPGGALPADELGSIAARSYRCGTCGTTVLPGETECPLCGGVRHPRWALAFGIFFGLGMVVLVLWSSGFFGR